MPPGVAGVPAGERLAQQAGAALRAEAEEMAERLLRVPPLRTWFHTFRAPPGWIQSPEVFVALVKQRLRAAGLFEGPAYALSLEGPESAQTDFPDALWVHVPGKDALCGVYSHAPEEARGGLPAWQQGAGEGAEGGRLLYSRGEGHWMIGAAGDGAGWVDSAAPLPAAAAADKPPAPGGAAPAHAACAALPHCCVGWRVWDAAKGWCAEPGVRVLPVPWVLRLDADTPALRGAYVLRPAGASGGGDDCGWIDSSWPHRGELPDKVVRWRQWRRADGRWREAEVSVRRDTWRLAYRVSQAPTLHSDEAALLDPEAQEAVDRVVEKVMTQLSDGAEAGQTVFDFTVPIAPVPCPIVDFLDGVRIGFRDRGLVDFVFGAEPDGCRGRFRCALGIDGAGTREDARRAAEDVACAVRRGGDGVWIDQEYCVPCDLLGEALERAGLTGFTLRPTDAGVTHVAARAPWRRTEKAAPPKRTPSPRRLDAAQCAQSPRREWGGTGGARSSLSPSRSGSRGTPSAGGSGEHSASPRRRSAVRTPPYPGCPRAATSPLRPLFPPVPPGSPFAHPPPPAAAPPPRRGAAR